MSFAAANSPEIVAVRDPATQRDLLTEPQPLIVNRQHGPAKARLHVQSGIGGPLRVSISADESWLRPDRTTLDIQANQIVEIGVTVLPDGPGEFALLNLAWQVAGENLAESVLIWRQGTVAKAPTPPPRTPTPPPPAPPPTPAPAPPPKTSGGTPWWQDHVDGM